MRDAPAEKTSPRRRQFRPGGGKAAAPLPAEPVCVAPQGAPSRLSRDGCAPYAGRRDGEPHRDPGSGWHLGTGGVMDGVTGDMTEGKAGDVKGDAADTAPTGVTGGVRDPAHAPAHGPARSGIRTDDPCPEPFGHTGCGTVRRVAPSGTPILRRHGVVPHVPILRGLHRMHVPKGRPSRPPYPWPGPRALLPLLSALCLTLLLLILLPGAARAQDITLDLGTGSLSARGIQMILLITVLSLAPGILITVTCFPFLVTVLSILRQALGLQQAPPNMLLISLALFLTWFIMEPVMTESWTRGIAPLVAEQMTPEEALPLAIAPFRGFMANRMDPDTFEAMAALRPDAAGIAPGPDAPLSVLIPSFMLSEIARAFQIGFLLFLPFLIIDLVVAAVLMSMGMMMVPPAIVSLPFKLSFFVIADGWTLLASALVRSYG